ncbi:MAG: hypothetical protein V4577_13720 [Bacteroidota bacterium]
MLKRVILRFIALLVFTGIPAAIYAQFQRIGIRAGEELFLNAANAVGNMASYCLDHEFAPPDGYYTRYDQLPPPGTVSVYIGKSKVPVDLNVAIKKKLIDYSVDDYSGVTFSLPPGAKYSAKIKSNHYGVFNTSKNKPYHLPPPDTKVLQADKQHLAALIAEYKNTFDYNEIDYLDAPKTDKDYLQDMIWLKSNLKNLQKDMKAAGQYNGLINGDLKSVRESISRFNEKFGLPRESKWSSKQNEILDFLLDIYDQEEETPFGATNLGESGNTHYLLIKDYQDPNAIEGGKPTFSVFAVQKNNYGKVSDVRLAKIGPKIIGVAEKSLLADLEKSPMAGNLLWVGSVDANRQVQVFVGGKGYVLNLNGADLYTDLHHQLSDLIRKSEKKELLLTSGIFDRLGYGNGNYDQNLVISPGENRFVNLASLATDLQEENETVDLLVGNDLARDMERLAKVKDGMANSKAVFLVNEKVLGPFAPSDAMLNQLKEQGLDYIKYGYGTVIPDDVGTILLEGDNESSELAYRNYLNDLGDQGLLDNKIVISNACHLGDDIQAYSTLIRDNNVKLFIHFSDKISPSAVNAVLQKLGNKLANANGTEAMAIWKKAVDEALLNDRYSPALKLEIKKLKYPVIQISKNDLKLKTIYPDGKQRENYNG